MPRVRGCFFPDDLLYDPPRHVWYRPEPGEGGLLRMGITQVGVALAREVLVFTPKRVGRSFEADRAMATVESAKWIGSVRSCFPGRVERVNEDLIARAKTLNDDCYGAGWMALIRPGIQDWKDRLVPGPQLIEAYEAWMEDHAFPGCEAEPLEGGPR